MRIILIRLRRLGDIGCTLGPADVRLGLPIIRPIPCSCAIDLIYRAATLACVDAGLEYILTVCPSLDVVVEGLQHFSVRLVNLQ